MHLLSQIIYSCKTLYMFRTVFPSIIRSSERSFELLMVDGNIWAHKGKSNVVSQNQ